MERSLLAGSIDVGLTFLPAESDEIESEPLLTDEVVLVVCQSHPLAAKMAIEPSEIGDLPLGAS